MPAGDEGMATAFMGEIPVGENPSIAEGIPFIHSPGNFSTWGETSPGARCRLLRQVAKVVIKITVGRKAME